MSSHSEGIAGSGGRAWSRRVATDTTRRINDAYADLESEGS